MSQNQVSLHAAPPKKKMSAWAVALIVIGSIFLFFTIAGLILIFAVSSAFSSGTSSHTIYSGSGHYTAVLHIEGTITSTEPSSSLFSSSGSSYDQDYLMATVDALMRDDRNAGIMLYIDSPGGEVYPTDELYLELLKYKEETGRPIYAYCASMAASGGYYLACSADHIFMNRNCMTGSIGVTAGTYIDISGFLEKQGIKTTSIYVGKNKTMGSYFEGFTDEQKEIYLGILQETYDQFVQVVADGRKMTTEQVTVLADGRVYSPRQAVSNGLADEIMTYEDARAAMITEAGLPENTEYVDCYPSYDTSLSSILGLFSSAKKTDLETYLSYVQMPVNGPAYYYEGLGNSY